MAVTAKVQVNNYRSGLFTRNKDFTRTNPQYLT